jgi:uncharacterized protein YyaL (SSP411 family)
MKIMANLLQFETSPYLLSHRNNPVHWVPWDEKFLRQAENEDKLVIVSIGYSACHWCHVMEHEVFEDEDCATLMNAHFVSIKVDREERPDIDHIYMDALQLMTGSGGWPLNCILLPDGRPVYGGTYFPKDKWIQVLKSLADIWQNDRKKMYEYAENLHAALKSNAPAPVSLSGTETDYGDLLDKTVGKWKNGFDREFGGPRKAPKFPIPNNYRFLLRYAKLSQNREVADHTLFTLKMMAGGGIYDQIGGGFARYSVDAHWKVPHFEKMLYDNAQLISLYAEGYAHYQEPLLKETLEETIAFCVRELHTPEGGWMSALDADSEGLEGKFYVWKYDEVEQLLGDKFALARDYYNINAQGHWEHGHYILYRQTEDSEFARSHNLSPEEWKQIRSEIKEILFRAREKRIRPATDDKILLSWNALMISALCDAYRYTRKCGYLGLAEETWRFIQDRMKKDGKYYRSYKHGEVKIPAFAEDYAFLTGAALDLAEAGLDTDYLNEAETICRQAIDLFWDEEKKLFRFKSSDGQKLIAETYEIEDNVIPSSNSQLAICLFKLSRLQHIPEWENKARTMLGHLISAMPNYGPGYSNWAMLVQYMQEFKEVIFVGKNAKAAAAEMMSGFHPQSFFAASEEASAHPLFEGRFVEGKTLRYECVNRACGLPEEVLS